MLFKSIISFCNTPFNVGNLNVYSVSMQLLYNSVPYTLGEK